MISEVTSRDRPKQIKNSFSSFYLKSIQCHSVVDKEHIKIHIVKNKNTCHLDLLIPGAHVPRPSGCLKL
jgi:hypothetical protein